jgi:hypothetical protein
MLPLVHDGRHPMANHRQFDPLLPKSHFRTHALRQRRPLDHLVGVREMLRISHPNEAGTHAAAARPTILPIRILHLRAAAHLHLSPDDAARENPPSGPRLWSLIVESESVYN